MTIEHAICCLNALKKEALDDYESYPRRAWALETAIAALREQEERQWVPVTERLPDNEVDVLICAERRCSGRTHTVVAMAFHTDGKMTTEDSSYNWDGDAVRYGEEHEEGIVREGWWESVIYGEELSAVDDFVTHWMPLPEAPKEDA